MAKGSATDDDISAGIRQVGVLSAVANPERARRDSPFSTPAPRPSAPPLEAPIAPPSQKPALPEATVAPIPQARPKRLPEPPREEPAVESSRNTEEVHVKMAPDTRTQVNLLAAELQRRRTTKAHRFTPNSVFRVAIEIFLEQFELAPGDHVNSEDELRRLVRERITAQGRAKRGTP